MTFNVNATGIINNTAVKTHQNEFDNNTTNDASTASLTVASAADISVNKTVTPNPANYGQTATFTINVRNNGPDNATGVRITDTLPTGLIYVSDDSGGAYNPNNGVWNINKLANGATATLNILVNINATGTFNNLANKTAGGQYDWNTTNDNSTVSLQVPRQSGLYVNVNVPSICLGLTDVDQITFKVGNIGPDTAENVVFTWVVPEGLEFVSMSQEAGYPAPTYDPATRTITWNLGNVTVGDPYLWVTVRILKQGTYLIKPSLTTSTYDPNLAQNIGFANLCAKKPGPEVNAAQKTIPMQPTGQPISALIMAIMAILSGLIVSKRI